ncbi:CIS tube protein [Sphingomonas pokkalii]|nr:hypothetical protein [Sphingomonas pokkalii]
MNAPTRMTITAYTDPQFTSKAGGANPFTVWMNPASYNYSRRIAYNDRQAQGASGPSPDFNRIAEESVTFELMFDATGVLPVPTGQSYANGVADVIDQFLSLVATLKGSIHSPNYLILSWAQLQYQCVLSNVRITYTLFAPNGTPLRAKMDVEFSSFTSEGMLAKGTQKQSPDLTHAVTVITGDTLPDLCYRIYGESRYYIQVARFNRLLDFRTLQPGTRLLFPPLSGSAA